MAKAFARQTTLNNIVGRSDYISNPKRQEHILFHSSENLHNSWEAYAEYETLNRKNKGENYQGRELIIALPHELEKNLNKLKTIVDEYAFGLLGPNRDFEYAVHWNEKKTNLHAHIIYSERERVHKREPKTYKRDMWYDIETNRMAKAQAEGSELRFKKDDVMKDKEGNIRYNSDPFTKKERHFVTRDYNEEIKRELKKVLNKYNFQYRLFDKEREVAQIHMGHQEKRTPETYQKLKDYNEEMGTLNNFLKETKTTTSAYKKFFKDLRINNKENYRLLYFKKAVEKMRLKIDLKKEYKKISLYENKIDDFYQRLEKREEYEKEIYKVQTRSKEKSNWNLFGKLSDTIILKVLENDMETKVMSEEEQFNYMKIRQYAMQDENPWTDKIDRTKENIEIIKDKIKEVASDMQEIKHYKSRYEGIKRDEKRVEDFEYIVNTIKGTVSKELEHSDEAMSMFRVELNALIEKNDIEDIRGLTSKIGYKVSSKVWLSFKHEAYPSVFDKTNEKIVKQGVEEANERKILAKERENAREKQKELEKERKKQRIIRKKPSRGGRSL